jgi:hypothetical protein
MYMVTSFHHPLSQPPIFLYICPHLSINRRSKETLTDWPHCIRMILHFLLLVCSTF